jgi:dTDP-4-amino-4,6-dideoxy-D-glucose acyltransferase
VSKPKPAPDVALHSPQYDYRFLKSRGQDVFISAAVEIRRPHLVSIGSHVAIDTGFYCTCGLDAGDYIHIAPYVTVIGGLKGILRMGHFTTIAAGSRIVCASDEFMGEGFTSTTVPERFRDNVIVAPVVLELFAGVGTNVVILPGVTLAEGSVIGACSLVTKNTEPWMVYAGIPARPLKARRREKMIAMAKELGYRVEEV